MSRSRLHVRAVTAAATFVAAVALLAAAPAVIGAPQPSQPPQSASKKVHTVTIEGLQYHPRVIVVRRGETVTWINKDFVPHTVTATGGSFDSHGIAPQGSWTFVPEKPGTYDYGCAFHPTMKGTLVVR